MLMDLDFYDNRFLMFVLDGMANDLEDQGNDVIRMTLGKSELPLHPNINRAMEEALNDFKKKYICFSSRFTTVKRKISSTLFRTLSSKDSR